MTPTVWVTLSMYVAAGRYCKKHMLESIFTLSNLPNPPATACPPLWSWSVDLEKNTLLSMLDGQPSQTHDSHHQL